MPAESMRVGGCGRRDGRKTFRRSSPSLGRFLDPISWRRVRDQGVEKMLGRMRHVVHGAIESFLVRFRRFRKTTQLPDELKR